MLGHSMLGGWGDGPKRISGVSCVRSSAGQFQVSTPQGPMNVTVPPGVVPGQSFTFQLPAVVATPVSAMPRTSPRPHPHAHPCPDPTLVLTIALALATATSSAPRYPAPPDHALTRWPRLWPSRLRPANRLARSRRTTAAVAAVDLFVSEVNLARHRRAWSCSVAQSCCPARFGRVPRWVPSREYGLMSACVYACLPCVRVAWVFFWRDSDTDRRGRPSSPRPRGDSVHR